MSELDDLKNKLSSEDNDLKAIGIYTKILREERNLRFDNFKDVLLKEGFNITEYPDKGKFTIEPTEFGIIDFYPKANKVLIRKQNKWIPAGYSWIQKTLIKGTPPQ